VRRRVLDAGWQEGEGTCLADAGEDVDAQLHVAPGGFDGGVQDAPSSCQYVPSKTL
jgi:hypothetical protein